MITLEPRLLLEDEIEGISDKHERLFANTARKMGLTLYDGGMITLPKRGNNRGEKRSTNPDFYIVPPGSTKGYYIEITRGENLGSRKANQKKVMNESGFSDVYFQLTGFDVESIATSRNLVEFLQLLRKRE